MLLIVMRHAQRGDLAHPPRNSSKPFDTPIAYNADHLITSTSKQISAILKKYNKNHKNARIVSSPFLRCVMTAEKVGECLGVERGIQVDGGFAEYLRTEWFQGYPMDRLVVCDKQESKGYLKSTPEYTHKPTAFPENYGQFQKRIRTSFQQLLESHQQQQTVILVTHGFAVRQICYDYGSLIYDQQIEYCGFQAELVTLAPVSRQTIKPLRLQSHL